MADMKPKKTETSERRVPLAIRLTARATLFSLAIAVATLALASVQPAGMATAALKFVFLASSSVTVAAVLLWALFSGIHFVFGRRDEDDTEPSREFWS
jgi:hypothetical protein